MTNKNETDIVKNEDVKEAVGDLVPVYGGRATVPQCKLCTWKKREEAEEYFMDKQNYTATTKWVHEQGLQVSLQAIRNHMLYHFKSQEELEMFKEYEKDVKQWYDGRESTIEQIRLRVGMLKRRMISLDQSIDDFKNAEEKRKGAEQVRKMSETILSHEKQLEDLKRENKPVKVIINQLGVIISDELSRLSNDESKRVLMTVLKRLKDSVPAQVLNGEIV